MSSDTTIHHIPMDRILPPETPSRLTLDRDAIADLATSIATLGLLEPIGVQPTQPPGHYRLIYGHRRYLALRQLGHLHAPAIILPEGIDPRDARLAENTHRVQLTPVEEAREIQHLHAAGLSTHAIARRLGKSPQWTENRLRLLGYPDDLLDAIHTHHLPLAVADALARVDHPGYRAYLIDEAIRHGATAATAAAWAQHYAANRPRLEANTDTVEAIAAERHQYQILAPCEYCNTQHPMQRSRLWRLCPDCSHQLHAATRPDQATQDHTSTTHA